MRRYKIIFLIFLILVIAFIAFLPSLKNGFVRWDDDVYVTNNQAIKSFSWENAATIFTSFYAGNYQPLTILSYFLDYHLCKLNPFGYHLTNLILHLLNCLLVFWLIFIFSDSPQVSFITAILFAIHPLRVESIAWISERKDVLYAFFYLGAMISYCYYLRQRRISKYYYLSLFLFLLSISSKAAAASLPLALFLIDYLMGERRSVAGLIDKIPFFTLSLLFGIVACFAQRLNELIGCKISFNLLHKFMIAGYAAFFYLKKIFIPTNLSFLYTYPEKTTAFILPFFMIVILILALLFLARRFHKIVFCGALYLITLLPVMQFIPIGGYVLVYDRYTYIPSVWIFYAVSEFFVWLYKKNIKYHQAGRIFLVIILIGIIIILAVLTWKRCGIWKDDVSLWSDPIEKSHDSAMTYRNRGYAYFNKGEYDKAVNDFNKALEIDPNSKFDYHNRGAALGKIGKTDDAILDFNKAIKIDQNYGEAYYNRGIAYMQKDDLERAISDFDRAIKIDPDNTGARFKRAVAYLIKKEYDKSWRDLCAIEKLGGKDKIDLLFREYVRKKLNQSRVGE